VRTDSHREIGQSPPAVLGELPGAGKTTLTNAFIAALVETVPGATCLVVGPQRRYAATAYLCSRNPQAKISGIDFKHGRKGRREPETERSEGEGD
jgi:Flp pilus assembly CpaE family ATPase